VLVSRVENGHNVPAVETLEKFVRALEGRKCAAKNHDDRLVEQFCALPAKISAEDRRPLTCNDSVEAHKNRDGEEFTLGHPASVRQVRTQETSGGSVRCKKRFDVTKMYAPFRDPLAVIVQDSTVRNAVVKPRHCEVAGQSGIR
jgi:hypothetical protein